jgi:hypothetical protein
LLWPIDGTEERVLRHVQALANADADADGDVDSTSVRAHQHAAVATKKAPPLHVRAQLRALLIVMPGLRADCSQFEAVLEKIRAPWTWSGRPRRTPHGVGADKRHSTRAAQSYLRRRGEQCSRSVDRGSGGTRGARTFPSDRLKVTE